MSANLLKCSPRQARKHIIECIEAKLVPFLQSSPGMGKSEITHSIASDFGLFLIDHRLSTSEPTDMTGLPRFRPDGMAEFAPFVDLFPLDGMPLPRHRLEDGTEEEMNGWMLFLDEFNSADRKVQAAAYKLILDRMTGQKRLHTNLAMVAAGNLITDRAIVNPISTAMQSRVVHLEMEINFEEWLEDVALKRGFDSRVIAYLMQYPEKLMDFRPDHHERTFCCPRTWEFTNRLIKGKQITDDTAILLTGTITSGVALEFVQFTKVYDQLVTVHDIRKSPKTCRIPTDKQLMWATVTNMMEHVDEHNFKDLATYAERFDMAFRILFHRSILVRKPGLRTHPDFGSFAANLGKLSNN